MSCIYFHSMLKYNSVIFAAVHVKGIEIPNSNNMKTTVSPVSTQQKVKVYATTKVIFV